MKNKLESLLNSLIEKGWTPFGKDIKFNFRDLRRFYFLQKNGKGSVFSIRELVSKDSGLWQFACKNGYNQYKKEYRMGYTKYNNKAEYRDEGDYEYYLIESALKDEDELESFILDNIKIGG